MLSSIGVLTVSTSRVVMVMLRSHRRSRWRSTFVPCTPILAMVPPGATIFSQSSKVAGMPTASMAVSTPCPPVIFMTVSTALPSALLQRGRGAETLRHFKAIVVEIDHDDLGRRVELGGEQRREPDRPRTDDRHGAARLHLAVEHAALEAGRQDVAQHHQRLFVGAVGNLDRGSYRHGGCGRTRPGCRRSCCRGSSRRWCSAST